MTSQTMESPRKGWTDLEHIRQEVLDAMSEAIRQLPSGWSPGRWAPHPPVNLYKDDHALFLEIALPGLDRSEVELTVGRNQVRIRGVCDRPVDKDRYYRCEIRPEPFDRTVRLPAEIDPGAVRAELSNGMLQVRLPMADPRSFQELKVDIQ